MKLAAYYAVIGIAYLALATFDAHAGQVAVPFVTAALLAPGFYSEWLRVRRAS